MGEIRRFDNFQHTFLFTSQIEEFNLFFGRFLEGDLGRIYLAVPWDTLVDALGLVDSKKESALLLSPQGKLALMFLKQYACCSDKRLVEQLNGNFEYQFFCGI